eukprot:9361292-Pyramimonas_sp.AAC.1
MVAVVHEATRRRPQLGLVEHTGAQWQIGNKAGPQETVLTPLHAATSGHRHPRDTRQQHRHGPLGRKLRPQ